MNKVELISKIANKTEFSKKDTETIVTAFIDILKDNLVKGAKISLSGFGIFETIERAGRIGRNPKTGETIQIKPSKSPKFKPAKVLKEAMNS